MFFAKVDGMEFRSQGADFGDSGPYELFLNTLVERAMERYDASCGDPYHFAASWISDQALGVDIEAINEIEDEIVVDGLGPVKKAMAPEAKSIQVGGYTKKDGTVVKPYSRDGDKKGEESSSGGSSLFDKKRPSVLHYKREGETDLDLLERVFEGASDRLGEDAAEQIVNNLYKEGIIDNRDVAAYLQLHVLSGHGRGKRVPQANQLLKQLLVFNPENFSGDIAGKVGGYGRLLEIASEIPPVADYNYASVLARKYDISMRDIEPVLHLSAFLRHSSSGGASVRKEILGVMMDREFPDGSPMSMPQVAEIVGGISSAYHAVGLGSSVRESVGAAFSDMISSGRMSLQDGFNFRDYIDGGHADVGAMYETLKSEIKKKHPAVYSNDIDAEEAVANLQELTDGFESSVGSFAALVGTRLEYYKEKVAEQVEQRKAAAYREKVLANANVNREQQKANDAVLKSQYADAEPKIRSIVDDMFSDGARRANLDSKSDREFIKELLSNAPIKLLSETGPTNSGFAADKWAGDIAKAVEEGSLPQEKGDAMLFAVKEMTNTERGVKNYGMASVLQKVQYHDEVAKRSLDNALSKYEAEGLEYPQSGNARLHSITLAMDLGEFALVVKDLHEVKTSEGVGAYRQLRDDIVQRAMGGMVVRKMVNDGTASGSGLVPFKLQREEFDGKSLKLFKGDKSDPDYAMAQDVAKNIQKRRSEETLLSRRDSPPLSELSDADFKDLEYKVGSPAYMKGVWEEWKTSSTTDIGKAMQLAATEEFGALGKPEYESQREAIIESAGGLVEFELLKIHLRSTWEATQFLLKEAGHENVTMWRGLQIPASSLDLSDEMKRSPRRQEFKLDNLSLLRNGLSSATTKPSVANDWNGIGDLPKDARRVVLRIDAGPEDVLSLPCFGDNIHSEEEVIPLGSRWNRWDAWLNRAPEDPSADWTPEPNESKSMITQVDGQHIIEFDGGGGWLEGYGEIDNELEVIGDEAFELAAEEENEDVAAVLKSIGQAMLEFTDKKGYVKPYTKADGTRVEGYYTGRSKKADATASPRPQGSPQAQSPRTSSGAGFSLDKVGDPMPKEIEVNGSERSTFPATKKIVAQDLGFPSDLSTVIKAAGVTETAETKVSLHPPGNNWTDNGSSVVLVVSNDGFKNIRAFYKDDDGNLVLKNESFKVYDKGKGLGTKMLARQIKHCKDIGVTKMTCDAIRVDGYSTNGKMGYDAGYTGDSQRVNGGMASGYYVWPLMGYDAEIDWDKHKDGFWDEEYDTGDYDTHEELMADAPESVRKAKRLSAIMRTEEGRKWWSQYGIGMNMQFDLSDGSQSMRIFNEYLKRKGMS